ncbi:MAG: hypothetical protein ABR562_08190 [Thermoplasmatota archaeon]
MGRWAAAPIILLLLGSSGCVRNGSDPVAGTDGYDPEVRVYNYSPDAVDVGVTVTDVAAPAEVAYFEIFHVEQGNSQGRKLHLAGDYNVSVTAPGRATASATMEFWRGSIFGGQMYAWITVQADGNLTVYAQHAD